MKTSYYVIFVGIIFSLSGCLLESPEQRLQRELEQELANNLNYYSEFSNAMEEYDSSCIERVAINECLKTEPNSTQEECKFIMSIRNSPPNEYWLNYPQCKIGAESQECEPTYHCKNTINDGGIIRCDPKELEDWERRCGFRK